MNAKRSLSRPKVEISCYEIGQDQGSRGSRKPLSRDELFIDR